jgi:hypothetical protein
MMKTTNSQLVNKAVTPTVQRAVEFLVHRLKTNLATRAESSTSLAMIAMMTSKT